VDFKTDDTRDNSRKKELDALYQKQLSLYAEAFEEVTGNKVHDSTIIYIEELSA
jgi:ATP-dependent exoDNAse (exonuclease V) beta subunit